ncbi:MAG: POTRA domain-containing protein [Terracidiphilus sp.]
MRFTPWYPRPNMPRSAIAVLCGIVAFALVETAAAQQFKPKTIQFKGDPEYSDVELLAAAGLKPGAVLTQADMNAASQRLMDTGMFASLAFKFDGQDLIFTLTPSTDLYPIQLENLPLTPGKELDARLHDILPLYHGKVPAEGGLAEDVRAALEKLLADRGMTATVTATTSAASGSRKVNAVSYSISSPTVVIGDVQLAGVSAQFLAAVQEVVGRSAMASFHSGASAGDLERAVEMYYEDQGYAAVKVQATQTGNPVTAANGIHVPFSMSVQEGRVYTIGVVSLPADSPVSSAEVDQILLSHGTQAWQGRRLRAVWSMLSRRYASKGYLDCKITPRPEFNDATGTVNYTVEVSPGPVYHLGFVKFDNVSDQLRNLLMHYWQMMPGDAFDESYVADFMAKAEQQDPALGRSLAGVKTTFDVTADQQTHDVNVVIHLAR